MTNIALTLPRSAASLAGQPHRFPVHLVEGPGDLADLVGGVDVDGLDLGRDVFPSVSLIRRTVSGSRVPATSRAPFRSLRSGPTMDRPMMVVAISAIPSSRATARL